MTNMNEAVIFSDSLPESHTYAKSVNAIAEVDEFDSPFAAEVLQFMERVGEVDGRKLLNALEQRKISHSYSDEVDALTFSFGEGLQSYGQKQAALTMEFNGEALVRLVLKKML